MTLIILQIISKHCQHELPNMHSLKCALCSHEFASIASIWIESHTMRIHFNMVWYCILCGASCNLLQTRFNCVYVCFPWGSDRRLIRKIWQPSGSSEATSGLWNVMSVESTCGNVWRLCNLKTKLVIDRVSQTIFLFGDGRSCLWSNQFLLITLDCPN